MVDKSYIDPFFTYTKNIGEKRYSVDPVLFDIKKTILPSYKTEVAKDGTRTIKISLPGFEKVELKLFEKNRILTLKSNVTNSYNKLSFSNDFEMGLIDMISYDLVRATLLNGVLSIVLGPKTNTNDKVYEIDIPQPDSNKFPQLLNEESDF